MANDSFKGYISEKIGFDVEEFAGTESDLIQRGLRKLTAEDAARVLNLFQYAPQIISNKITEGHVKASFREAVEGSFRVLMDVGAHLGNSHKTAGAFSPNTYNANNNFLRPAELIANDAVLSIPQVEQLIANAFNAASLVTGQYFMSQISASLTSLKSNVTDISDYIEDEKMSKFQSYLNQLESMARRLRFIQDDIYGRPNYAQDAEEVKRFADELMDFYKRQIEKVEKRGKLNDNKRDIDNNGDEIIKYLLLYYQSLRMYCEGVNIGVCLERITDKDHLRVIYDEMAEKVAEYESFVSDCIKWLSHYVHNLDVLNKRTTWQNVLSIGGGIVDSGARNWAFGLVGIVAGIPRGIKTTSDIMKKFDDDIQEKKSQIIQKINSGLKSAQDIEPVQQAIETLKKYLDAAASTEFVKIGDVVYTNMPLAAQ